MMGYNVKVDRELCIGAGACVAEAPDAFKFDDENIAVPKPGADDVADDRLMETARACPASAILVFDDAGNEVDVFS
ncbi:MAG: ferredoxin [Acidimicrobiia bacterium]